MKNYIIYLPDYPVSVAMANKALASALDQGWDAELWPGVDGSTVSFNDLERAYRITACSWNKKCYMMVRERPGVRGCFLSHWKLWHRCREEDQDIGIFEHDVLFLRAPKLKKDFNHVLKLEGFQPKPVRPAGVWYEGARAYILRPAGADRLIRWVQANGCLPADVNIGLDVVEIEMQDKSIIALQNADRDKASKHQDSFTWNLGEMQRQT
jgi:hypothetical protein